MPRQLPMLVLLVGCKARPACEADPHRWYESVTQSRDHVDRDGHFNFDPPGEVVTKRKGSFDDKEQSFEWTDSFAEDYPIIELLSFGSGEWSGNGDLDLTYFLSTTDRLDQTVSSQILMEREACSERWEVVTGGPGSRVTERTSHVDLISDKRVEASSDVLESDGGATNEIRTTTTYTADLRASYTLSYEVGDWAYQGSGVDEADGTGTRDWVADDPDYDYTGHFDYFLDGDLDHIYNVSEGDVPVAEIAYRQSYSGDAIGTWSFYDENTGEWDVCDYTFGSGYCTVTCPGAQPYDC